MPAPLLVKNPSDGLWPRREETHSEPCLMTPPKCLQDKREQTRAVPRCSSTTFAMRDLALPRSAYTCAGDLLDSTKAPSIGDDPRSRSNPQSGGRSTKPLRSVAGVSKASRTGTPEDPLNPPSR